MGCGGSTPSAPECEWGKPKPGTGYKMVFLTKTSALFGETNVVEVKALAEDYTYPYAKVTRATPSYHHRLEHVPPDHTTLRACTITVMHGVACQRGHACLINPQSRCPVAHVLTRPHEHDTACLFR